VSEHLDPDLLPFTFAELTAALLLTCRREADARASAVEYRQIIADRRREGTADAEAADPTPLPLEILAALALGSPDAAERVKRVRQTRMPGGASAPYLAEEDAYWAELLEKVRGWRDHWRKGASDEDI
jgi:hypothetical protein